MKRSASRGFTLIELMFTVALLAILTSLAAPSFARMMASNRMATQTNEFTAALNLARLEAVRRGQPVAIRGCTVVCDGTDDSIQFERGWKVFTDNGDGAAANPVTATDGTVIRESGGALGGNTRITRVTRGGTAPNWTYADATSSLTDRMYVVFNSRGANTSTAAAFFRVCDANDTTVRGRIVQISTVGKISLDTNTLTCP
jgi:type IV fimbrial biogenesis protein FimT